MSQSIPCGAIESYFGYKLWQEATGDPRKEDELIKLTYKMIEFKTGIMKDAPILGMSKDALNKFFDKERDNNPALIYSFWYSDKVHEAWNVVRALIKKIFNFKCTYYEATIIYYFFYNSVNVMDPISTLRN